MQNHNLKKKENDSENYAKVQLDQINTVLSLDYFIEHTYISTDVLCIRPLTFSVILRLN